MAQLNQDFDASTVEPAAAFELLPPGNYVVRIVQSEMRATKAGDGQYLWLEMDILDGPHQGRKLWDQLNLVNPKQQTVDIAQRTLSAICHAVGQMQVADSEQLHFRAMQVTLAVEFDSRDKHLAPEERRKQNKIKGYTPMAASPSPRAGAPAPNAAPAAPRLAAPPTRPTASATPTAPWRRAG
jgi:hypothetical protein